MASTQRVRR
jgi:hypothetical protein